MRARPPYDWSSPATLVANRAGELTDEQQRLIGRPLNWGCLLVGSAIVLAGFVGLAVAAARNGTLSGFVFLAFPLVIVAVLLGVNRTRARARDDAIAGRLAFAQGQVVWQGARYVAKISGRRLRPLGASALPAPGLYTFCYLAHSGELLSAEPLPGMVAPASVAVSALPVHRFHMEPSGSGMQAIATGSAMSMENDPARMALVDALARTLHFTPADLTANRAGRLSAAQRRTLRFEALDTLVGTFAGVAGAIILTLGALAVATYTLGPRLFPDATVTFTSLFQQEGSLPQLLTGASALLTLLLVVSGIAATTATRPILQDIWADAVASIEGEIRPETGLIRAATVYYYVVRRQGGESDQTHLRFIVSPLAYRALVKGRTYRLYYLPHHHTLLSVEPLASSVSPQS